MGAQPEIEVDRTNAGLLRASQVSYRVGEAELLRNISLTLNGGEVVGLIGPNGAGKSTLLRVLSGLWRGATGQITLCGQPLGQYRPRQIAQLIGHVAQSVTMDAPFTV